MSSCAFDEIKRKKNKQTKKTNTIQSCCNGFGLDTFSVKPMEERGHKEINYRNLIVCHICSKTRQTNRNRKKCHYMYNKCRKFIKERSSFSSSSSLHFVCCRQWNKHAYHCFQSANRLVTKKKPKAKNKISSLLSSSYIKE